MTKSQNRKKIINYIDKVGKVGINILTFTSMISKLSLATDTIDLTAKVVVSEGGKKILKKVVNNALKVAQNQPNMGIPTTISCSSYIHGVISCTIISHSLCI